MAGLHAINALPRIFAGCDRHSNHLTSTSASFPVIRSTRSDS